MNALAIHLYLTIQYINLIFNNFNNFYRIIVKGKDDNDSISKLKKLLSQDGEYILGFNGKDGIGHVVNVITINGQIVIHDEQINKESDRYSSIDSFCDIDYFEVIKIDKAILNIDIVRHVLDSI